MFTYSQSTGVLMHNMIRLGMGYSGHNEGRNNPKYQNVPDEGPIPKGFWVMSAMQDEHGQLGPHVIPLTPGHSTETFGRSGFYIHGDSISSPGFASHGCIILPRTIRDQMAKSNDYSLTVIP